MQPRQLTLLTELLVLALLCAGCGGGTATSTAPSTNSAPPSNSTPPPNSEPSIVSVQPSTGPSTGGTAVAINGSNFRALATVKIGTGFCSSVSVLSPNTIHCITPAGTPGSADVEISNSDGTSATLMSGFDYNVSIPGPTITGVSPISGPVAGGTLVTITGTNFRVGASVDFGSNAASSVTVVSSNTITAITPAGQKGVVTITVLNSDSTKALLPKGFSYSLQNSATGLAATAFGFQCGTALPTNCPHETWPTTAAQPGVMRLWDSQVQWSKLNAGRGTYNWSVLDAWLDTIATHQPRSVIYTFGWTPCWATTSTCLTNGSTAPPDDLGSGGSQLFNAFVTSLVSHCNPSGRCVKDYINYWEIWNEANSTAYWSGTVSQLYALIAPAVKIIRAYIPDAQVLTPPASGGDASWMQSWLATENTMGRLSDIYAFHLYLKVAPEERFSSVQRMLDTKNTAPGWATTPWWNTETNFQPSTYVCSSSYAADDCTGQIVRWQLLHNSNGAANLSWYYFETTIGHNSAYANAYYSMMQWLVGSTFAGPCSANGSIWSCLLTLANGNAAEVIWDPSENCSNGSCSTTQQDVSPAWTVYQDLDGNRVPILNGTVPVGVKPILLTSN
jgi:hypothetical protein